MEISSSGNQLFWKCSWKSDLLEELIEISSSRRHDGNKIFWKISWKSDLSEELMEISTSGYQHFRNQVFQKL